MKASLADRIAAKFCSTVIIDTFSSSAGNLSCSTLGIFVHFQIQLYLGYNYCDHH